ncbi:MAG: translation elongation factor Ts [Nitrospirae bacterium]|nr:translation elongation factor Ts [Nitrospirota bacterium]
MSISPNAVKELREQTGAGLMECKKALTETGGDIDKAKDILRQKGLAIASKKASRAASEGVVDAYIHMGKLGVLIEVNCETDFVAKTDDFRQLVRDIAMQVAASSPSYVRKEEVPPNLIEKEKEIYASQITGKPANIVEKIVEGKLEKFYADNCLMDQIFIKDTEQKKKVSDIITEKIAKLGENIVIKRFARFQVGEKI